MSAGSSLKLPLEIEDIKAILPHRYPFLLVDRILEFEEDRRIVGLKNVTSNERYFIAGPGGVPILPASILTAIFGRKKVSYSTIGRGTTTARGAARAMEQREDVKRAKDNLAQAQQELDELNAEVEEKIARMRIG